MKIKEFLSKFLKIKKVKRIIIGVLALVVIVSCALPFIFNNKPKADTKFLNALLSKSSELTTSKLNITGITTYTDTGISVINRSDFTMVYKATVRAGIKIDEVNVSADDNSKIIYIIIPKAEIQEVKVDPSTIKYLDEKISLFNWNGKEDANKAQAFAEEDAKKRGC